MKIVWFTSRSFDDLCSTTQLNVAEQLEKAGLNLTMVNPDFSKLVGEYHWKHVPLSIRSRKGLNGYKCGKAMKRYFEHNSNYDLAIVDWKVSIYLINMLESKKIRWILMDRSPPADGGFFAKLQRLVWKKSWSRVRKNAHGMGCVVSQKHARYISEIFGINSEKLIILPVGVNLQLFLHGEKTLPLKLVYHGKLDKNRGIMTILQIFAKLSKDYPELQLHLHGDGDLYQKISTMDIKNIYLTKSISQLELSEKLATYDIGFLPMPKKKIWEISSPLKLSEYIASGMIIFGINHAGHYLPNSESFISLFEGEKFIENTVSAISSLEIDDLRVLQSKSRIYAENNLNWEIACKELINMLLKPNFLE